MLELLLDAIAALGSVEAQIFSTCINERKLSSDSKGLKI